MSRILVTGAAGFIGSHVSEALLCRGDEVIGVDNLDAFYSREIKEKNLKQVRNVGGQAFELVEMDITNALEMERLFLEKKPDTVIHLAARAGVRPSLQDPVGYAMVNVVGTSVLLKAAEIYGVKRFVMASSSSVYGNYPIVPFQEEMDVNQPISPYAATKRSCEMMAHAHYHVTKMPTACLRFFTVFGPRQRPDLAIQKFLRLAAEGKTIQMFGDGSTSRDYTYIDDIVDGILSAVREIDSHGFRIWNLGGSTPHSLKELIEIVGRVTGKEIQIQQMPMQAGDVERTFADISRAKKELGFEPKVSLEEGMRRQWQWMNSVH